jgi:DNA-binding GntR family transcriptional regulator
MPEYTGRPLYLQVADDLRRRIVDSELRPGDQIPPLSELVREYDTSSTTVRQAITVLRNEGHLLGHQGKGIFVRRARTPRQRLVGHLYGARAAGSPMAHLIESFGADPRWDYQSEVGSATSEVARRLGIVKEEPVMVTQYRFLADSEPILISTSYEPLALTRNTPIEYPEAGELKGVVPRFDSIGMIVTHVVEQVTARAPRPYEVDALAIPEGVPVMSIIRTYFSNTTVVETADLVVAGDNYTLSYIVPIPETYEKITNSPSRHEQNMPAIGRTIKKGPSRQS